MGNFGQYNKDGGGGGTSLHILCNMVHIEHFIKKRIRTKKIIMDAFAVTSALSLQNIAKNV